MSMRKIAIASLIIVAALPWLPARPTPILAQSQDPCATATTSDTARTPQAGARERKYGRLGNDSRDIRDLLQQSDAASQARARATSTDRSRPVADRDDNHIAILEDNNG